MLKNNIVPNEKISPQFQARLRALPAGSCVRVLLLLDSGSIQSAGKLPRTREERQVLAQAIRAATEKTLPDIDAALGDFAGRRLAERPNSLGVLPVETTSAGLYALAALDHVKTILEDQPIEAISARATAL